MKVPMDATVVESGSPRRLIVIDNPLDVGQPLLSS